jgi:hypothetical protein
MGNSELMEPLVCCCGHPAEYHFGGPELTADGLAALRLAHPGGDGGMCRASVGIFAHGSSRLERCDCFGLCDCNYIARDIQSDGTDVNAALALSITERDWVFPVKL